MSVFWLGNPTGEIVPKNEVKVTCDETRYFKPGILHGGEDYLLRVYWYYQEEDEYPVAEVQYLWKDEIRQFAKDAETNGNIDVSLFEEEVSECCENFIVRNDGTAEFSILNDNWNKSIPMEIGELLEWAKI